MEYLTTAEKWTLTAVLAVLGAPLWLYLGAAMYDSATTDGDCWHSGFCPDCPTLIEP